MCQLGSGGSCTVINSLDKRSRPLTAADVKRIKDEVKRLARERKLREGARRRCSVHLPDVTGY